MSTPSTAVAGDSQSSAPTTANPRLAMQAQQSELSPGERVRWFGRGMFSGAARAVGAADAAAGAAGPAGPADAAATAATAAATAAAAAATAAAAAAAAPTAANAASAATAAAADAVSAAVMAAATAATAADTAATAAATAAAAADAASAAAAAAAEDTAVKPMATAAYAATVAGDAAGASVHSHGLSAPLGSRSTVQRSPALPVAASAASAATDDIARGWLNWAYDDEPVDPAVEQPNLLEGDLEQITANQGLLGRLEPAAGEHGANHDGDLLAAGSEHSVNDESQLPDRAVDSEAYLADVDDSDYGESGPVPERFSLSAPVPVLGSSPPVRAPGRRGRVQVQGRASARRRVRDGRSASLCRTPFPSSSSSSSFSSSQGWEATCCRFRDLLSTSPTPHPRYRRLALAPSSACGEEPDLHPCRWESGSAATARSPQAPPPAVGSSSPFGSSSSESDVILPGFFAWG